MIRLLVHPHNNWLDASGYTHEEQEQIFEDQLNDIIRNPRWYLDNLKDLKPYRVYWGSYTDKTVTIPKRLVKETSRRRKNDSFINQTPPL